VTVTEPYNGGVKLLPQTYDATRGGVNRVDFVYLFDLYNLSARVVDRQGMPVQTAIVEISGLRSKNLSTNSEGIAWAILPLGDYSITVRSTEEVMAQSAHLNRTMQLDFIPTPLTNNTLLVNLVDDSGFPLGGYIVRLDIANATLEAMTNSTGSASFNEVRVFYARLDVANENATLYTRPIQLTAVTVINITFDTRFPDISNITMTDRNVGDAVNDVYEINVTANITDSWQHEGLNATIFYIFGDDGQTLNAPMRQTIGTNFTVRLLFSNIDAPFDLTYFITAMDSANNSRTSSRTRITINQSVPVNLVTPEPTITPGGADYGLLGPIFALAESINSYMWVLIMVVLVVLGGTVFVFVAVNTFFYVKMKKLKKP